MKINPIIASVTTVAVLSSFPLQAYAIDTGNGIDDVQITNDITTGDITTNDIAADDAGEIVENTADYENNENECELMDAVFGNLSLGSDEDISDSDIDINTYTEERLDVEENDVGEDVVSDGVQENDLNEEKIESEESLPESETLDGNETIEDDEDSLIGEESVLSEDAELVAKDGNEDPSAEAIASYSARTPTENESEYSLIENTSSDAAESGSESGYKDDNNTDESIIINSKIITGITSQYSQSEYSADKSSGVIKSSVISSSDSSNISFRSFSEEKEAGTSTRSTYTNTSKEESLTANSSEEESSILMSTLSNDSQTIADNTQNDESALENTDGEQTVNAQGEQKPTSESSQKGTETTATEDDDLPGTQSGSGVENEGSGYQELNNENPNFTRNSDNKKDKMVYFVSALFAVIFGAIAFVGYKIIQLIRLSQH